MSTLILPGVFIIVGIFLLLWSADLFIKGAISIANKLGAPRLLIGIVIIGFGTSLPELIVSATSALKANPKIALGNAYGSNIFNIGLILGITAIINPIIVQTNTLKREFPILILITLLSIYLLWDLSISRTDSIILLVIFLLAIIGMMWQDLYSKKAPILNEEESEIEKTSMSLVKSISFSIIGLIILISSSNLLLQNAVEIAQYFNISELIIGLTIVAIGTSLPELASSIVAARKGENSLALGNIIGSNIFNTLTVVGVAGVIHQPFKADAEVLSRDMPVMLILSLILLIFSFPLIRSKTPGMINRIEGLLLLIAVILYNISLFYLTTH
ncbi:MAG: calcium/sodium antiporter [Neisseriaceae bacterium]|nr:MAG: calcium/sodium antiporter [Neisseriaceae bacterium]